jgi:hypothetical protein
MWSLIARLFVALDEATSKMEEELFSQSLNKPQISNQPSDPKPECANQLPKNQTEPSKQHSGTSNKKTIVDIRKVIIEKPDGTKEISEKEIQQSEEFFNGEENYVHKDRI